MVTGPDLSSQHEVSVSMEMDQLSGNLLLFMHRQGGEVQERGLRKGRVGVWARDRHLLCSHLHTRAFAAARSADQTGTSLGLHMQNEVKRAAALDPSCGKCYNNTDSIGKL